VTVLSVNLNKIAVLRNSRGGTEPSLLPAARTVTAAGAGGLTVHPRPDRRHVTTEDVVMLAAFTRSVGVEFNIEGNPFAAPRAGYPGLLALVRETRPTQVTLVPDGDGQITSDHGFDPRRDVGQLTDVVGAFRECGCRVSIFVDAGCTDFRDAAGIGVNRVELYTGPYAHQFAAGGADDALMACVRSAEAAHAAGMGVNAGHDLSLENLGPFLQRVPRVAEVSIGHALISEALYLGLDETVRRYLRVMAGSSGK
jgi:pyridoxine 5-phosphate synthase